MFSLYVFSPSCLSIFIFFLAVSPLFLLFFQILSFLLSFAIIVCSSPSFAIINFFFSLFCSYRFFSLFCNYPFLHLPLSQVSISSSSSSIFFSLVNEKRLALSYRNNIKACDTYENSPLGTDPWHGWHAIVCPKTCDTADIFSYRIRKKKR